MASGIFVNMLLLLFAFTIAIEVAAVENTELDSMLNALRRSGYHLFSNAIETSDLVLEILDGKSFTFFAPTDSALFALDMSDTASDYVATLRCHIIPARISVADIRSFPSDSYFPTLFRSHRATIRVRRIPFMAESDNFITVDQVGVTCPGLFYSLNIAVHGLGGIIDCNSHQGSPLERQPVPFNISNIVQSPSSVNVRSREASSPSPANLYDDHSFGSPVISHNQFLFLSPASREIPSNRIQSPEREQPTFGSAPANSPELLPSQISPASDLWSEVPTPAPTFFSITEPPLAPEFSENNDGVPFPPSSTTTTISLQYKEVSIINMEEDKTQLSNHLPVFWPEDLDGIMETIPDESQPFHGDSLS